MIASRFRPTPPLLSRRIRRGAAVVLAAAAILPGLERGAPAGEPGQPADIGGDGAAVVVTPQATAAPAAPAAVA